MMMSRRASFRDLIVHAPEIPRRLIEDLGLDPVALSVRNGNGFSRLRLDGEVAVERLMRLRERLDCDINALPAGFDPRQIRLLVSDMDSTLIGIECIDEIADYLGVKEQVARITESAMRGDIDFTASLRQRVALLAGLDAEVLEKVYQERLFINPGAETLIAGLQDRGIRMALVSGGFTFFTSRLAKRLDLDYTLANELEIDARGRLTGKVLGDIVDAQRKAGFLGELCQRLGVDDAAAIAVGDGANDLPMMARAGLSVAYHAKPAVQEQADCAINHSGLDAILHLLAEPAG